MSRDPFQRGYERTTINAAEAWSAASLIRLLSADGLVPSLALATSPARVVGRQLEPVPRPSGLVAMGRDGHSPVAPPPRPDDGELVRAAQADPEAFGIVYERYVEPIYRYCLVRLPTPADAEDATATTFVRAYGALGRFLPRDDLAGGGVRPWLYAIAHNVIVSRYRDDRPTAPIALAEAIYDPDAPPDEQAIAAERRAVLCRTIAALSDDQRRVVELRLAGLSGPEIAATLGRSHGSVKMLQLRAVDRLRTLIGDRLAETPDALVLDEPSNDGKGVSRDQR